MFHNMKLDITEVDQNILLVGQCWKTRTEILSERNNINDLKNFLENTYSDKFLIWRFDKDTDKKVFQNSIILDQPDFSINMALSLCKSVKGWLQLNNNNICVFEVKGNIQKFCFLLSCVLKFNNICNSCIEAFQKINEKRFKNKIICSKTLEKYLNYFDQLFDKEKTYNLQVFNLKQLILTDIPEKNYEPVFKVFFNGIETETKIEKSLIDDNYLLIEFNFLHIYGDIKLQIYQKNKVKNILIFEIYLNTSFINEGLFRYAINDLIFPFSDTILKKKLSQNFTIDIALINLKLKNKGVYTVNSSYSENLRILSNFLNKHVENLELMNLIKLGYNKILVKLFLQLGCSIQEVKDKIENLGRSNTRLIITKENIDKLNERQIKFINCNKSSKINNTDDLCKQAFLQKPFYSMKYDDISDLPLNDIELIPENFIFKKNEKKSTGPPTKYMKLSNQETKQNHDKEIPNIVVKYPLHWQQISNIQNTFFSELDNIEINFDYLKFEEWFCEPATKSVAKEISKKVSLLKDEKRIFLISISIKTLQKHKIDVENLFEVIYNNSDKLDFENLQNILRILPSENDVEKYGKFLSNPFNKLEDLIETEQFLFKHIEYINLKKVVEILLFERKFTDEFSLAEAELQNIADFYENILGSNNLRIILKAILVLGNMINFRYSKTRLRKKAIGFRVTSLSAIMSYKPIKKDATMISYLYLTLIKEQPRVMNIFIEFASLTKIKNLDNAFMKEKINKGILSFRECKYKINKLNTNEEITIKLKNFLGYAYEKLKKISDLYKKTIFLSSIVKRKFGENENESINDILGVLSDFLNKLEEEHNIQIV
ncbi:hypothetical protein GVAV_000607 [Gurleya vavrai]